MSNSYGAVKFQDGTIKHFEYNGTVDVCQPKLFNTIDEVSANWRTKDWPVCHNTDHNPQKVEIATTYGGGFYWSGFACKECNILVSPLDVDYDSEKKGLPDWYPNKKEIEKYYE